MLPTKEDKNILFDGEYKLASLVLGDEVDENWKYVEFSVPTTKIKQVYINSHTHNLPVYNHAHVFRWMMPSAPNLYSETDRFDEIGIKTGFFRLTVGKKFQISEDEFKEITSGVKKVDDAYLQEVNEHISNAFVFNTLKIPYLDVRADEVDESSFSRLYEIHTGRHKKVVDGLIEKTHDEQTKQLARYFSEVKQKISEQPNYLLILRDVVRKNLSVEDAIEMTKKYPGIFKKGI